jgi:hypothetical protein
MNVISKLIRLLLVGQLLVWGFVATPSVAALARNVADHDCVILLHGLARTASSMEAMQEALADSGFYVVNVDYPSRKYTIQELSHKVFPPALAACRAAASDSIHFVTHSMGGILVRYYLQYNTLAELGRVVMLSPPNQGSEVVDELKDFPGFRFINGPAGQQLGTGDSSVPLQLGPPDYEVGIITGNRTINFILSLLIPGDDDGKVSVERARLEGMVDFVVVPHTHPFIMESEDVIRQTTHFLRHGRFAAADDAK